VLVASDVSSFTERTSSRRFMKIVGYLVNIVSANIISQSVFASVGSQPRDQTSGILVPFAYFLRDGVGSIDSDRVITLRHVSS